MRLIRFIGGLFKPKPKPLTDTQRVALFFAMSDRLQRRLYGEAVEPIEATIARVLGNGVQQ